MTGRESLRVILAARRVPVLLVQAIVMMAKFMHEHMKQSKSSCLRFGKPAKDRLFGAIESDPQPAEYLRVRVKIGGFQFNPKILGPCIEKNRARFFPVVKLICTVIKRIATCQNDALQPLA